MVRGRMKVEQNPLPGEPAKTPQFDTTGKGDFENISPLNPMPVTIDGIVENMQQIQKTQNDILIRLEGTLNTQLTGSKVEKDTILSRTIIDNSHHMKSYNISAPNNATGFIIYLRVFGVTGSFEEGQGLYLSLFEGDLSNQFLMRMDTAKTTEAKGFTIYRYPLLRDDVLGDMRRNTSYSEGFYYSGLPISRNQRLYTYITGDFGEGEGFDAEIKIDFILN